MIELHWTILATGAVLLVALALAFALAYRKLWRLQDRITRGIGFFFLADGRKYFVVEVGTAIGREAG